MSIVRSSTNTLNKSNGSDDFCTGSLAGAPIGDEQAECLRRIFAALANPVRLRLPELGDGVFGCYCVEDRRSVEHASPMLHGPGRSSHDFGIFSRRRGRGEARKWLR